MIYVLTQDVSRIYENLMYNVHEVLKNDSNSRSTDYLECSVHHLPNTNERASYADSCADVSSSCGWPFYGVFASFRLAFEIDYVLQIMNCCAHETALCLESFLLLRVIAIPHACTGPVDFA